MKSWQKITLILLGIAVILFIWQFPELYIQWHYSYLSGKEQLDSIKDIRSIIVQIAAGILAIIGIYLTWRRTKALDTQNLNTQEQIEVLSNKNEIDKETNDNNLILQQFSKASELLANENSIAARLSGIYLFEKIMNSSEDYHWQIIELLTAYVREKRSRYDKKYFINKIDIYELEHENYNPKEVFLINESDIEYYQLEEEKVSEEVELIEFYRKIPVEEDIQLLLLFLAEEI